LPHYSGGTGEFKHEIGVVPAKKWGPGSLRGPPLAERNHVRDSPQTRHGANM